MFVTVLGWAFVGLGAFGAFIFALISLVSAASQQWAQTGKPPFSDPALHMAQAMQTLPPPWPWLYAHESQLMLVASAWMLLHLACALGLLWRRGWARACFIALMITDIVLQLLMVPYALVMQPAVQKAVLTGMPTQMPPAFASWMHGVMAFQQIEALVRPVVLVLIFGWIIWRLRSAAIRQEFVSTE